MADAGIDTLSEQTGMPLERDPAGPATGPLPFNVRAFSAQSAGDTADAIARNTAAELAQTLGKHYAPILQIVLRSGSAKECLAKVETYCASLPTGDAARIIEEVLIAQAANGAAAHAR